MVNPPVGVNQGITWIFEKKLHDQGTQCRIADDLYEILHDKLEIVEKVRDQEAFNYVKEKHKLKNDYEDKIFVQNRKITKYMDKLQQSQKSVNIPRGHSAEFIELQETLKKKTNWYQNLKEIF